MTLNFQEAVATLRKGASEAEIKDVEDSLGMKLPLPTRILYRFCDGQEIKSAYYSGSELGSPLGLIGGYSFSNHHVNVYLLPLSQIIMETKKFVRHRVFLGRDKYIVMAASSTCRKKLFFLNCTSGQLFVGTKTVHRDGKMIPCVPCNRDQQQERNSDQQQDSMLLWLEEHGRRLHDGVIQLREEGKVRSIKMFPEALALCSTAVTNGVQIRASAVFVPELSDLSNEFEKYLFSYSIHMRLLPEGCITDALSFSSCQLCSRHWIIRANDIVVSDINGEGVIGKLYLNSINSRSIDYRSAHRILDHFMLAFIKGFTCFGMDEWEKKILSLCNLMAHMQGAGTVIRTIRHPFFPAVRVDEILNFSMLCQFLKVISTSGFSHSFVPKLILHEILLPPPGWPIVLSGTILESHTGQRLELFDLFNIVLSGTILERHTGRRLELFDLFNIGMLKRWKSSKPIRLSVVLYNRNV
ncbi:hypothetical protein HHK36_022014 [Tetracentron sinense]|uniref:ApaG domain-containing protein n=1 Tax=Tetracentron sinense TaxID=13715 RepID=A0A834YQ26_TETSI|nr:hypothetical protein HHK36_022014 [Tetracentron sinense]